MMKRNVVALLSVLALPALFSCSSPMPMKTQEYAELRNARTFEYDFPTVWNGIEKTVKSYKVLKRDPNKVSAVELKNLTERTLETDWITSQSRDKYVEYKVNGSPRKRYVQIRVRYEIVAKSQVGGTDVAVNLTEETEQLRPDGTSAGYERSEKPDSSRANEFLERLNLAILSAAP